MADINPPNEKVGNTQYIKCDVTSWDDQVNAFKQAYEWQGRLDFAALNAGIDDRDDIFSSISSDSARPPSKPNMKTMDVLFTGTYYGIKLASHYMSLDSREAGKPKIGGKIVVTASAAGIYVLPHVPIYCAGKHSLVGLVRSLGPKGAAVNIRINAVCPALINTNILPSSLKESFTEEMYTPMATIMRCFSELADLDNVTREDWVEQGLSGETVEGNQQELIWHKAPPRPVAATYANADKARQAWSDVYGARNVNYAASGGLDV